MRTMLCSSEDGRSRRRNGIWTGSGISGSLTASLLPIPRGRLRPAPHRQCVSDAVRVLPPCSACICSVHLVYLRSCFVGNGVLGSMGVCKDSACANERPFVYTLLVVPSPLSVAAPPSGLAVRDAEPRLVHTVEGLPPLPSWIVSGAHKPTMPPNLSEEARALLSGASLLISIEYRVPHLARRGHSWAFGYRI